MRKLFGVFVLVALLIVPVMPILAQDAPQNVRFRLVNLSPDSPPLRPYLDGAPSGIQDVGYPSITGWVEYPGSQVSISLIPVGRPQDEILVGPVALTTAPGEFVTLVVAGSVANGTVRGYVINADVTPIPAGMARVTVFNGVEDGAPAALVGADGVPLVQGVAFPGGTTGAGQPVDQAPPADAGEPQAEPGAAEQGQPAGDAPAQAGQSVTPLSCTVLPPSNFVSGAGSSADGAASQDAAPAQPPAEGDPNMQATQDVGMDAAAQPQGPAGVAEQGQVVENCAYSLDIPANTSGLQFAATGAAPAADALATTQLAADTYYFVAAAGSADGAVQTLVYATDAATVAGLMDQPPASEGEAPADAGAEEAAPVQPADQPEQQPGQEAGADAGQPADPNATTPLATPAG